MKKIIICLVIGTSLLTIARAEGRDSNVVISNVQLNYSFDYNRHDKAVKIKEEQTTTYNCLSYRTEIPIGELYNDKTTVDEVKITVDGNKAKNIIPQYQYYSVGEYFFTDEHICNFLLPIERAGSSSQVHFEKTITDPHYFSTIFLSDDYNVQNKTVTFEVPRWMKLEIKEFNFAGHDITKTTVYDSREDADIITYTIKNLSAITQEGNSPGITYTQPNLLVHCEYADVPDGKITYFNTLADQYAWYRSLTKDLESDENLTIIKAKALEITAGTTTDMDKVKKVLDWVHENIRYIAFEDGIAGYKPQKADVVLNKKYGDCKGMANLTKELLKSLGFDGRLCWIGTDHILYDYSTPSLAIHNHMITALLYQGKTYFLDGTETYISVNEYAERIQGRPVIIEDGDKYIYATVPTTTYQQNLDEEKSVLIINGTDLNGTVTREWKGEEKEYIFAGLNAIEKENTTDAFTSFLSLGNRDYTITNLTNSGLTDYDDPLSVKYQVHRVNAVSSFGKDLYVDIDSRKDLNQTSFDLKERVNDYWFDYKSNVHLQVELAIPDGYTVSAMPPNVSIKNEHYEITATISKLPGKLIYNKNIIIIDPHLSKTKFDQWNKDIKKLEDFYNEQIVLTRQ
ncbi:MAG TPA: transglutaminase domain-containing protein [Ferruginibacter sp.]|nr:transglutaminase domain-containing protein [Ferruginibacter sp.]